MARLTVELVEPSPTELRLTERAKSRFLEELDKYDREVRILGEKLTYAVISMPCGHLRGPCTPTECWRQPRCYLCSQPTKGVHRMLGIDAVGCIAAPWYCCLECHRRYL